jgi:hypothetical protein
MLATVQTIEPRINTCSNSPSRGLFLTSGEQNVFLGILNNMKRTSMILIACVVFINVKITLLLGMVALFMKTQTSTLAGPMLRATAPF